jgi:predicted Zn-dependent protease
MKLLSLPAAVAVALALWAVPQTAPLAQVRLPSLGESVSDDVTVANERKLGDQIMREIRRDPDYLDDPLLLEYVQNLWSPLVASARRRGDIGNDTDTQFAWEPFLVRDRSVNAFALPGGFVGVHLGLIGMTASGDELASVLAHEMSHVTQRHIARTIVSSQRTSLVSMATMILGMIVASRSNNSDIGRAAVMSGQAAMVQAQLNFSRDMEREADRIGFGVFSGAGYAPEGMAQMFGKLEQANRLNDSGAFPYLRSHPMTVERIGDARARVESSPKAAPRSTGSTLEHALMQARARVLMDPSVQALRRLQGSTPSAGASAAERLGAHYASSLASLQLREPARAQESLEAALAIVRSTPDDGRAQRSMGLLQAQWLLARGEPARAIELLDGRLDDRTRPWMLLRAQAALDAARANTASRDDLRRQTEGLQTWVAEHRNDALAWSQLAQGADYLGLRLRALRADAESRAASGDLSGAIDRLRAAQRVARSGEASPDFIEASIIDARWRELEAQRRQIAADLRGDKQPQ